jgi:hypothetical protein
LKIAQQQRTRPGLKILISYAALFRFKSCLLSANGAGFIASLGQAPQNTWPNKILALKARLSESRFQRFVTHMIRMPGALRQANLRRAPLAQKEFESTPVFLR